MRVSFTLNKGSIMFAVGLLMAVASLASFAVARPKQLPVKYRIINANAFVSQVGTHDDWTPIAMDSSPINLGPNPVYNHWVLEKSQP